MSDNQFRYQTYQPSRQSVISKPAEKLLKTRRRPLFIAVAGLVVGVLGVIVFVSNSGHFSTSVTDSASAKAVASPTPKPIPSSLKQTINSIIATNSTAQVGVALENITSGEVQTYGIDTPFEAASTAKLITAAAFYHLVETGQASLSTTMGSFNAGYQIKQMINQSNNESWDMLVAAIGDDQLQSYASSIGLDYKVDGNTLSPASLTTLLAKLATGTLLNKTDTSQLLSYMQNTNDEALIPAVVSSDITVYHKYGLLDGELHDAAILTKDNQSYALVIYTKSTDDSDDPQRTTMIHQITQAVTGTVFNN